MGFASWLTADTRESIYNRYTDKCRTVYLLQPDGEAPIQDDAYDGYCNINGESAYIWVALHNLPKSWTDTMDCEELRIIGTRISRPLYSFELEGTKYSFKFEESVAKQFQLISDDTDYVLWDWNDDFLVAEKTLTYYQLVNPERLEITLPFPLKFSFNPNAKYEDLNPSDECPNLGFF